MSQTYSPKKTVAVNEFTQLIEKYPIIAAVDMQNLPARQLQLMREQLRDTCEIRMTKRRLLHVAMDNSKKDVSALKEHLKGMPALLFTKENPFTLFKILKKNKSPAPAKGGQTAPNDIIVKAQATPFAPGPIIGELGSFGLKTGVENGKVAIKADKVVCKEGDVISPALAGLLTRLQIYPMEVGLALTAVYEDGEILTKNILDIDEEAYLQDIMSAAAGAFNLSVNASIPLAENIELLLINASNAARGLARESAYITKENAEEILGVATRNLFAITSHLPQEALTDELRALASSQAAAVPTLESTTQDSQEPEEEDDEEDTEGAAAAGMGALFG
ncbi:MAG: 50S ribosomal protein L10 [Candidatus Woesearchaeota archaeon]